MPLDLAERQRALSDRFPAWRPRTLDGMLHCVAKEYPDRPFVIGEDRQFTYAAMDAWTDRLAGGLAKRGVGAGDHVALIMANYPEFVALKFAIARVGAVAVPINVLNRQHELTYLLAQSDSVLLVTMNRFRDLDYLDMLDRICPGWEVRGGGPALPRLREVMVFSTDGNDRAGTSQLAELEREATATGAPADPTSCADIIYTSGTTGDPKGVMLTHDMLLRAAFTSALARGFEDGRRILFALPMFHVFGYVEGLLAAMFAGGAIIPRLKFDAAAMLDDVERHGANDILAVPTMTLALIDAQRAAPRNLETLRSILSSGARAPARVWDEIANVLGIAEATTGYGMTEATASTTVTRPDDPPERLLTTNGRLRDAGVAGDPALGGRLVAYRVVDPHSGRTLDPGEIGELRARGPGVTAGYYNKPDATAAAFDDEGWLRTGDLGSIDLKDYLVLTGRLKESYRCGGEQVLPTEIEDLMTRHPDVIEAHVVPVPDERMGEVGAAFVILVPGSCLQPEDLTALCAANLARFKVPKYVLPVTAEDIPTTASGRARKFLLTQLAMERLNLT